MTGSLLVTGARAPVAQDLARALRAVGHEVHLADSVRSWASRAMRPRFPVHRLPPPRHAFGAFRVAMLELIEKTGARQVIPSCEEVFWLSQAAQLDGYAERLFAPTPDLLRRLHSKADFPALAGELGIDVPETMILNGPLDIASLPAQPEALVFKPEFSRFATHTLIGPGREQLRTVRPTPACRWVAQRKIEGEEYCSWAAVRGGHVVAFAAYRPRWRLGKGAAFQLEAVPCPSLRAITERIAAATEMSGHLSFDAIQDASGRIFPIECNPRAVSGVHLLDASAALGQAVSGGIPCPDPVAGTLRHMGPAMALLGLPAALRHGRLTSLMVDWKLSRDVIDREGGGLVSLACMADAAGFAIGALRSRRSPAGATTADIEWDGEAMA